MIDLDLVNISVDFSTNPNYIILDKNMYPKLFLGFLIKNQYDNERLDLNPKYNPIKICHIDHKNQCMVGLFGIFLKPNKNVSKVIDTILSQEKTDNINLLVYNNILNQHNLSCKETYGYFKHGIYPIDFENLKNVCDESFNSDKKIFQHLLSLDEKVFDFQKFASLKLFILTA